MALADTRQVDEEEPEESRRRHLMAESDRLLEQVETLRLMDEERRAATRCARRSACCR